MEWLANPQSWVALLTLTALEIVLGIDNIIFISILAGKLPKSQQDRARSLGLLVAMFTRVLLLLSLNWISQLTTPIFEVFHHSVSGRDLILLIGGLFLLGKATLEIHDKLEGKEGHGSAQVKASFAGVITGEVLGQRPMSQHRNALQMLERESGLEGLLLRPLSAQLLRPTIPETEGWVDRGRLHAFQGRSRKPQMQLAEELEIEEYPQPAGGCLLTDENYARRFRDAVAHTDTEALTPEDMMLLAIGRHFRVSEQAKCIVGREEAENAYLDQVRRGQGRMAARDYMGPVTLVEGVPSHEDKRNIARITARYSDGKNEPLVAVTYEAQAGQEILWVEPMPLPDAHSLMI